MIVEAPVYMPCRPVFMLGCCLSGAPNIKRKGTVQARTSSGSPASSHPSWQPHPIQGWTPDFIPLVLQEVVDKKNYDQLIPVAGSECLKWATKLAQKEGIMTGISGGASLAVAMKVAENAAPGSMILCMIADSAERYITTPLFDAIEEDMNAEELALSRSTPGFQIP